MTTRRDSGGFRIFKDREQAGEILARLLRCFENSRAIVVAIPRGGVAVGYSMARALRLQLDIIVPRKLPIPEEPEAGFGAVTSDGTVILNEKLVSQLGLPKDTVDAIIHEVRREVERREAAYRQASQRVNLRGRTVILVDDGLASGYTMLAAVKSLRNMNPLNVAVAVPCAPSRSIDLVAPSVDELYCLIRSEEPVFAVASYYMDFRDLTDEEVVSYLRTASDFVSS